MAVGSTQSPATYPKVTENPIPKEKNRRHDRVSKILSAYKDSFA